jgi:hypothetical protein
MLIDAGRLRPSDSCGGGTRWIGTPAFIHNDRDIDPVLEMPAVVMQAQSQLRTAMRCERCRVEHRSAEGLLLMTSQLEANWIFDMRTQV